MANEIARYVHAHFDTYCIYKTAGIWNGPEIKMYYVKTDIRNTRVRWNGPLKNI